LDHGGFRGNKNAAVACGVKKSKDLRSANRRDSRKPLGDEAAHADEQWGRANLEIVNHGRDYT
jgi:hypothetical protein